MEHLRILDKGLGDPVPGIVGRSIVLVLVGEIMVGNWMGVALLGTLATSWWGLIVCLGGLL